MEPQIENEGREGEEQQDPNQDYWCFSYFAGAEHADFNERAALLKSAKWQPGDRITISFLDGSPVLQQRVMKAAKMWIAPGMANLKFNFRSDTNETDIRISFRYSGSWSALGTTCKETTDISKPTMNFGWLTENSTDQDVERVVLHEFGHAIGLIHEHMSPKEGIKWNRDQVIFDLSSPPNEWDLKTIEHNMFQTFNEKELELTKLDVHSIMMYPIPAKWTLDGFSVGLNKRFSETDIKFIRRSYPGNDQL